MEDIATLKGNTLGVSDQVISTCSSTPTSSSTVSFTDYFVGMFSTDRWPARWTCGEWSDVEGWLYILSDLAIFLAYMSIPVMLLFFNIKQRSSSFKWVILLFASFITLCGITHLIDAILFWEPVYRLSGFTKMLTGFVSIGTAVVLGFVLPRAIQYKSPETLQREVERRQRLQNQMETFVHYCPGAIAMVDNDMRYILVNANWSKDYGLEGQTIIGKSHYEVFPGIADDRKEQHQRALNGESLESEFEQFGSGESAIYVRWKLHPWHQPDDLIGGIIIFTEIITDEVLIKRQLKERDDLILQKTKELQDALEELESFSYSVSHDLRAPLRAIHGFSEALLMDYKDKLDEQGAKYLNRISANSTKMGKLIDELLQFSRLDRRKKEFGEVDLGELISRIIKDFFPESSHYVEIKNIPVVYCDPELMNQVFINLISNAIKYSSKEATPKVLVEGIELEDSVVIAIKDNGVGFNMEYSDKLFKVFQRLHSESEFEGTGVGLALCSKIIKAHAGEIWAESEEGRGATFFVKLKKQV